MRYSHSPLLGVIALAAFVSLAGPARAQVETDRTQQWFLTHDRNHDGYITIDEALAYEARAFQRMDREGNGRLREDEFCSGIPPTNIAEVNRCQTEFTTIDTDHDAYVTLDEINAYFRNLLQSADKDQDGRVSMQEFMAVAGQL